MSSGVVEFMSSGVHVSWSSGVHVKCSSGVHCSRRVHVQLSSDVVELMKLSMGYYLKGCG